jgi:hypothetical protein
VTRGAGATANPTAAEIIKEYLALPFPEKTTFGDGRLERLAILERLSRAADVLPMIRSVWPTIANPGKQAELAETIGRHLQTSAGAAMLTEQLKDPSEKVRSEAVRSLRLLARRVDRSGGQRIQRGPEHPPIVEGLVPALITAANDAAEQVRVGALYALADTLDSRSAQEIRKHLDDASREVRLHAACFLTEFQDPSGVPELTRGLERLRNSDPKKDFRFYFEAESILAGLERITSKSFGEIPMNPGLFSLTTGARNAEAQYAKLVGDWWAFISSTQGKALLQKFARQAG